MPAKKYTRRVSANQRIGLGNDVHRLVRGRKLVLGGVEIPFEKGPKGHSDGDALSHAICDALLGAAAMGDIGRHFPDSSPAWKGKPSLIFLERIREMLEAAGFRIVNIDATIGLERPKLAPFVQPMARSLARILRISESQLSIKAKTGEGVDAVGRGAAIRADAVALLDLKRRA